MDELRPKYLILSEDQKENAYRDPEHSNGPVIPAGHDLSQGRDGGWLFDELFREPDDQ